MKSVMNHGFGQVPISNIEKSTFDRSHGYKTAFNEGKLIPFYVDEVLPGDTFNVNANIFARMATQKVPVMDNIFLDTQYFFVPSRLVWKNFTKMMGERVNPQDSIDFLVPTINSGINGFDEESLADYFGIPVHVPNLDVSVLPFRCYQKIWDDWYRPEQIVNSFIQSEADLGDDTSTKPWNTLQSRYKRCDYFTSCLPSPQLGAGVTLPLGVDAPVIGNLDYIAGGSTEGPIISTLQVKSDGTLKLNATGFEPGKFEYKPNQAGEYHTGLKADLTNATAATINSLRTAFQIQRMLETDARSGGCRYIEIILAHFKTVSPDGRLQRSEYLGGSSAFVNQHAVVQNSQSATTPQGNLASFATCTDSNGFTKSFTEHGYVIGLVSVRCDLNYQRSLDKMWSRRTRYDFYWPTLAHLGEQAVLNKEIYCQGKNVHVTPDDENSPLVDDEVFGYQERYAEYRYHPSRITGKLNSNSNTPLDVWHLAQDFSSLPVLNGEFLKEDGPIERCIAVPSEPHFIMDCYISCKCTRPMPVYAVPGLIDHL